MERHLYKGMFVFAIVFVLTIPLFLTCINTSTQKYFGKQMIDEPNLVGVTEVIKSPGRTFGAILDGSWETYIEKHFADKLVFRKTLTRLYNQFLWTAFESVDLPNVVVGKNHSMLESEYIGQYFSEADETITARLKDEVGLLSKLRMALEKRGIPVIVCITPSKAVYYPGEIPSGFDRYLYMKQNGEYKKADYEVFAELLSKSNVPVYNPDEMIRDMVKQGLPVFVPPGIHWTSVPMEAWINGFQDVLGKQLGKKLGKLESTANDSSKYAFGIDADLLSLANILGVYPYYTSDYISFKSTSGEATPNLFICGGSFNTRIFESIYSTKFNTSEQHIWGDNTEWSWYNTQVRRMPQFLQNWIPVAEQTADYASILKKDAIVIEINQSMNRQAQLQFAQNLLNYLEGKTK